MKEAFAIIVLLTLAALAAALPYKRSGDIQGKKTAKSDAINQSKLYVTPCMHRLVHFGLANNIAAEGKIAKFIYFAQKT